MRYINGHNPKRPLKPEIYVCPVCGGRKDHRSHRCLQCAHPRRSITPGGYIRVWEPFHPLANGDGYVLEHRKVLHDAGWDVIPGYHIHHINEKKTDNRISNLMIVAASEHHKIHAVSP